MCRAGLPLRVVSATPDGQVLERFEFAQFQLGGHSQAAQLPTATPQPYLYRCRDRHATVSIRGLAAGIYAGWPGMIRRLPMPL